MRSRVQFPPSAQVNTHKLRFSSRGALNKGARRGGEVKCVIIIDNNKLIIYNFSNKKSYGKREIRKNETAC